MPRTTAILLGFFAAFLLVYLAGFFNLDTKQGVVATGGDTGVVLVDGCHLSSWVAPAGGVGAAAPAGAASGRAA